MANAPGETQIDPADLLEYLQGLDYPASKGDLLRHVTERDAPAGLLEVIEKLPDQNLLSDIEVVQSLRIVQEMGTPGDNITD